MSGTSGKNHFYEMKEDVGMSLHEKERNKMPTPPRHKPIIIPSLHLCSSKTTTYIFMCQDVVLFALPNKQTNNMLKQNKDVGMGL